jgi:hypothetical protein
VLERTGAPPENLRLAVAPGGELRDDDRVDLDRATYRVAFAPADAGGYPPAYRRAVLDGLRAVMGEAAVVEVPPVNIEDELPTAPALLVGEPEANRRAVPPALEVLALGRVPDGTAGVHVDPSRLVHDVRFDDVFEYRRLDATGCDLVFPPRADGQLPEHLVEEFSSGVRFAADPLAGTPAPVDHPIWPLFLDALVSRVHGRGIEGGWRASHLLDPEETLLGRDVVPFDPSWVTAAPRRTESKPLRDEALGLGAACAAALWMLAAVSRRRTVP